MRLLVNAGCGPAGGTRLPTMFRDWQQLRVDSDPAVSPDIVASITDLSAIPTGCANALWSAHCVEHLYGHEVVHALCEFYRVLADDGFACVIVPDLQAIAQYIATDRLHEPIYQSNAGPVSAHDMIFGFGSAIAQGRESMAHRCGFTPTLLMQRLQETPFAEIVIRRRVAALELIALLCKGPRVLDVESRNALMASLEI
jgi:hypothetical protein